MRKATKADKEKVIDIICKTFDKAPGINWMLRKSRNRQKQIKTLADYAFIKAYLREGAFISSNEKGVALCYKFNYKVFSIKELLYEIRFTLLSVIIKYIPKIFKLEGYKKSRRLKSGEYLYFWFFGVLNNGDDAGFELKNAIFKKAFEENLPIYAETSMKRNKIIYERYGFETFHYWTDESVNLQYWFMKWEPKNWVQNNSE